MTRPDMKAGLTSSAALLAVISVAALPGYAFRAGISGPSDHGRAAIDLSITPVTNSGGDSAPDLLKLIG